VIPFLSAFSGPLRWSFASFLAFASKGDCVEKVAPAFWLPKAEKAGEKATCNFTDDLRSDRWLSVPFESSSTLDLFRAPADKPVLYAMVKILVAGLANFVSLTL
jgi:hypothetical protein